MTPQAARAVHAALLGSMAGLVLLTGGLMVLMLAAMSAALLAEGDVSSAAMCAVVTAISVVVLCLPTALFAAAAAAPWVRPAWTDDLRLAAYATLMLSLSLAPIAIVGVVVMFAERAEGPNDAGRAPLTPRRALHATVATGLGLCVAGAAAGVLLCGGMAAAITAGVPLGDADSGSFLVMTGLALGYFAVSVLATVEYGRRPWLGRLLAVPALLPSLMFWWPLPLLCLPLLVAEAVADFVERRAQAVAAPAALAAV